MNLGNEQAQVKVLVQITDPIYVRRFKFNNNRVSNNSFAPSNAAVHGMLCSQLCVCASCTPTTAPKRA